MSACCSIAFRFIDPLEPVAIGLADPLILLALGQWDHLVVNIRLRRQQIPITITITPGLPAHGEKMLAYKAEQRLGTGETMRRRELIALMGARRRIRMDEGRIAEQHLIGPGPRSTENG